MNQFMISQLMDCTARIPDDLNTNRFMDAVFETHLQQI